MFENVVIVVFILKGSCVMYEFDFVDGFEFVCIINNIVIYCYVKYGVFNVLVIVSNIFFIVLVYFNMIIMVEKLSKLLEICGFNVLC